VIYGMAIAAMALFAAMIAMTFWAVKRSFAATDATKAATKEAADLAVENILLLQGKNERDAVIAQLQAENDRLRAAIQLSEADTPPLETKEKPGATIRDSMEKLRAAAKTPLPSILTPRPAPRTAAPGSVVGDRVLQEAATPIAVPGAKDRPGGDPVHGAAPPAPKRPKPGP